MAVIFPPAGAGGGGGGTSDHGALTGLGDDDHTQYHNNTRGDIRYYPRATADAMLDDKADAIHGHVASDITVGEGTLTTWVSDVEEFQNTHTHAVGDLETTGTASGSTFLRGDGAWTSLGSTAINLVDGLEDIPGDAAVDSLWAIR